MAAKISKGVAGSNPAGSNPAGLEPETRAKKTPEERRAEMMSKMARLKRKIDDMDNKDLRKKQKFETRDKVLLGVVTLNQAKMDPRLAEDLVKIITASNALKRRDLDHLSRPSGLLDVLRQLTPGSKQDVENAPPLEPLQPTLSASEDDAPPVENKGSWSFKPPFEQKGLAKQAGAKFDPQAKTWVAHSPAVAMRMRELGFDEV